MQEKLVSVIIPTYNAERTIDKCLESIVNQTYRNLQIICCDDCSNDNTFTKLQEWANKDPRIEVLKNEANSRAAFTRNRCIERAEGAYIAQIDDDDYCAHDRIEKQVAFLESHPEYGFVSTGAYYFDDDGIWGQSQFMEDIIPSKEVFLWNAFFLNPSMMYRKEVVNSVGGYRIAKETRRSEDYDMHMRMYIAGYQGYTMAERLTYYYRGKNSFPKCKYEYRIDEAIIRWKNYKKLGLMPRGIPYVIKPLVIGLVPIKFIESLKRKKKSVR